MKRIYGFDYIRGISAILIMLYHYTVHYYDSYYDMGIEHGRMGVWWGCYAVSAFFMLSAYLTVCNLRENENAGRFLLKRAIRLYPTYWAAIIITTVLTLVFEANKFIGVVPTLINFTTLQGFLNVKSVDGVYWTLRCELLFYVLIAIVIKLKMVKRTDIVCSIWLAVAVCYKIAVAHFGKNVIFSACDLFIMTKQAPAFVLGVSAAAIVKNKKSIHAYINSAAALYLSGMIYRTLFIAIVLILMIIFASSNWKFKYDKPIVYIASISYPLYLLHQRMGYIILRSFNVTEYGIKAGIVTALCVVIGILTASMLHTFVEIPSGKYFKRKLSGS
ncbi:MAG: acyltransferase [Clostridia bacterium]|nr:acyltransferase [Clostridia bacterium]